MPRVERGEFINVGVILSAAARAASSQARIELDAARLAALDPPLDLEEVARAPGGDPAGLRAAGRRPGPSAQLPPRERFHWLVAPRSTIIQTSAVHSGLCTDPARELEHLLEHDGAPTTAARAGRPRGA